MGINFQKNSINIGIHFTSWASCPFQVVLLPHGKQETICVQYMEHVPREVIIWNQPCSDRSLTILDLAFESYKKERV